MTRKFHILSFALAAMLAWSCEKKQDDLQADKLVSLNSKCRAIVKDAALYNSDSQEKDDAVIKEAKVVDNCLELTVAYGGGCVEQEPDLVWNGGLSKSLPPIANLKLHFHKEDNCEALVTKTYAFDLLSFYTATGYNEIRLNIIGVKDEVVVKKAE